jgi:Ca2+-binding RTX toxin-like protein
MARFLPILPSPFGGSDPIGRGALAAVIVGLALLGDSTSTASAAGVSMNGNTAVFGGDCAPFRGGCVRRREFNRTVVRNDSDRGPGVVYFYDSGQMQNPDRFGPQYVPITLQAGAFCSPVAGGGVRCGSASFPVRTVRVVLDERDLDYNFSPPHAPFENDRLICTACRGPTRFEVEGGGGADALIGGVSNDTLRGGLGNDALLFGGAGNDVVDGGAGADTLTGGAGNDTLNGAQGPDQAYGGNGNDSVDGGPGNDRLSGIDRPPSHPPFSRARSEGDRLRGGEGDDVLTGWYGPDILDGGSGFDILLGDRGNDFFYARDGVRDQIRGSAGFDRARADRVDIESLSSIELRYG